jgi:hypothetical protein
MGEEVGDGVGMSRDMVKCEIKVLKELHPSSLPASNLLRLAKVLEVFVICSDMNGVVGAEEVGAAAFKPIYDGSHLFIVDVIVLFGW